MQEQATSTEEDILVLNSNAPAQEEISAVTIAIDVITTAVPMALSFTFSASQVATAMMIARLDSEKTVEYLAAAALITTLSNILAGLSFSPLFAMSIRASKKHGNLIKIEEMENANDTEKSKTIKTITDIFKSGTGLSMLIAPIPFAGFYFSRYILSDFFGQDAHISELAQQNLRPYAFAIPGLMYRMCAEQMMFSFGKTTPAMIIGLVSFGAGTGLSLFLAFGKPQLGLAGIAYGYVAEAYLTSMGFCLYLGHSQIFKDISFFNFFQLDRNIFRQAKKILQMGLPITLQMASELFSSLLIGLFAGWRGKVPLAAQDFSTQLFIFAIIPSISFGQTVAQKVSRLIGQKDFTNAMRFSRYGLLTTLGVVSLTCVPLAIWPKALTTILSTTVEPIAMALAKILIPLAVTQVIYDTASYNMTQVLRAGNDLYVPTFFKTACLWLGVLAAYFLGFHTSLGIYGIGIGFLLGVSFAANLLLPRWMMGTTADSLEVAHTAKPEEEGLMKMLYQKCTSYIGFFMPAEEKQKIDISFIEAQEQLQTTATSTTKIS